MSLFFVRKNVLLALAFAAAFIPGALEVARHGRIESKPGRIAVAGRQLHAEDHAGGAGAAGRGLLSQA